MKNSLKIQKDIISLPTKQTNKKLASNIDLIRHVPEFKYVPVYVEYMFFRTLFMGIENEIIKFYTLDIQHIQQKMYRKA